MNTRKTFIRKRPLKLHVDRMKQVMTIRATKFNWETCFGVVITLFLVKLLSYTRYIQFHKKMVCHILLRRKNLLPFTFVITKIIL